MKTVTQLSGKTSRLLKGLFVVLGFCFAAPSLLHAQTSVTCPPNIDFSFGNFNNWLCYTTTVSSGPSFGTWNLSGPVSGTSPGGASAVGTSRHALTTGTGLDYYGGFPEVAPGGGLYSLRLGNDREYAEAERVQYYIHVPVGFNNYSFNFKYAVVFEDPSHSAADQPRFIVRAFDSATGDPIVCASQTFVSGGLLPGFMTSPNPKYSGTPVYYLPWTVGNLNLSGSGGKTIIVEVISADCTQSGHFGYGYFDVISCGQFNAAITFCDLKKGILTLQGPAGYKNYKWYNQNFTTLLSSPPHTAQTINVPAPPTPTYYNLILTPFAANGCPDTIKTKLLSDFQMNATPDTVCNTLGKPIQLGVTATGGLGGFTYNWTGDTPLSCYKCTNPLAYPTNSGYYVATVSDTNGCFRSDTVRIENPTFHVNLGPDITTCIGTPVNLNPTLTPANGAGFIFNWTPGTGLSNTTIVNPTFTPSGVGTQRYIIRVDSGICATADTFNIRTLPNTFTAIDTTACEGDDLNLKLIGADTNFRYSWTSSNLLKFPTPASSGSDQKPSWLNVDTTRTFTITAKYPTCPDIVRTLNVRVEPVPRVFLGADTVFKCLYQPIYITTQVFPTWFNNYSYAWRANDFIDKPSSPIIQFTGREDTTLRVTVRTPLGCRGRDSVRIHVYQAGFGKLSPVDPEMCPRNTVTMKASGGIKYRWSPSLYLSDSTAATVSSTPVTTTPYTLYITDRNGCIDTLHSTVTVHPEAVVSLPDSVVLYPGESYQFHPEGNLLYYNWFPTVGLSPAPNVSNPLASPTVNTRYYLNGTTEAGCVATDSVYVLVREESAIGVANAFSPGSAPNGEFRVSHLGTATLRAFRIYNRWGTKVYESSDITKGWDGTYNGTPQPMGVYIYTVEALSNTGKVFTKQGNVTLLR